MSDNGGNNMSEHVERMKVEHEELCTKTIALNAFIHGNEIFKSLDTLEQVRIIKQAAYMESYAAILASRLLYCVVY
jgi:hypothetical protein